MKPSATERLREVMATLRDPQQGCPWDLQQTFHSIAPYTIEEAYEVADAIAREDLTELKDELGDLLFQVVFHARMAEEAGAFDFDDVADGICQKMLRRHPHVFSDRKIGSATELNQMWEDEKSRERQAKQNSGAVPSALDGVALNLPALTRAEKIQKRARRVGFDWQTLPPVAAKVEEELAEVMEVANSDNAVRTEEELGDLLFAVVNLARHVNCDPETALRKATAKFSQRFTQVEKLASEQNAELQSMTLTQLDELWDAVKATE